MSGKKNSKPKEPSSTKPALFWKVLGILGSAVMLISGFYRYQFEFRPILEITAPNPLQLEIKDGKYKFEIPFHYRNAGRPSAIKVKTYHAFFTYPPGWKDQAETEVPDLSPGQGIDFNNIKFIDSNTLYASTNFIKYQNLLVITTWQSDNLAHTGLVYSQAQWYRIYLTMQPGPKLGSYLTLVRSKYDSLWNGNSEAVYNKLRKRFVEGETLSDAYDLKELERQRGSVGI